MRLDDLRHELREQALETERWALPPVPRTPPKRPLRGLPAVALVAAAVVAALLLPGLLSGGDSGRDFERDSGRPAATAPPARLTELAWEPEGAVCQAMSLECVAPGAIRADDDVRLRRTFAGRSDPLSDDPAQPAFRVLSSTDAPPVVYVLVGAVGASDGELRIDPGLGTPLVRPSDELHLLRLATTDGDYTVEVTERRPTAGEWLVTAVYEPVG